MSKVTVVNKYKHTATDHDVYIGRGSVFGNPFSHLDSSHDIYKVDTREEAITEFKTYFKRENVGDTYLFRNVEALVDKVRSGEDINLVCFCKPKACHGDVIKEYIDNRIKEEEENNEDVRN